MSTKLYDMDGSALGTAREEPPCRVVILQDGMLAQVETDKSERRLIRPNVRVRAGELVKVGLCE